MGNARGKRTDAAKRQALRAKMRKRRKRKPVKPSKASYLLLTIHAKDPATTRRLVLLLDRARFRRAAIGERVPEDDLENIERETGGRVKEDHWYEHPEGPPPYPYTARFDT